MAIKIMDCKRCGHEWATKRADNVRVCPRCKSPYFDRERKQSVASNGQINGQLGNTKTDDVPGHDTCSSWPGL